MAENKESKTPKVVTTQAPARRPNHVIIGANVAVASLLMVGLVVAVNFIAWWATREYHLTKDMTRQGLHSFSSRTTKVLDKIEEPVRMTSLFYANEKDEDAVLRKRRVEELLDLYEAEGHDVTVDLIDPVEEYAKLTEMGKRITKLHADETQPYADVIKRYLSLNKTLLALLQSERTLFERVAQDPEVKGDLKQFASLVAQKVGEQHDGMKNIADNIRADVGRWIGEADAGAEGDESEWRDIGIPRYSDATSQIGEVAQVMSMMLNAIVQGAAQQKQVAGAQLPDAARQVLDGVGDRYADVLKRLVELDDALAELKPLALDDFRNRIQRNTIIVELPDKARVVEFDEIWPVARSEGQNQMSDEGQRSFGGEEALTSALIRLSSKTKTAAVFVIHGGMPVSEHFGQYTELASRLSHNNFEIANWDLTRQADPPETKDCDKRVFILMPPDPQQQQMMGMPPSPPARPETYEPVRKLIESGETAMVFLRVSVPEDPNGALPYLSLLKTYGLKARTDVTAATALPQDRPDGTPQAIPVLQAVDYPSKTNRTSPDPIIAPLQGLLSGWPGAAMVAPDDSGKAIPGLRIDSLVEVPKDEEHWGETNLMMIREQIGAFDEKTDVSPPFAVAVAARRTFESQADAAAGDASPAANTREGRMVVLGTDVVAMDYFMKPQLTMSREGLRWLEFPGNGELLVNAMLWLGGQEDMIAVSSVAMQYSRIGDLGDGKGTLVRWLLWGALPLAVVLVGIVVYSVRARAK